MPVDDTDCTKSTILPYERCRFCYRSKEEYPEMQRCACGTPYCSTVCQKSDWKMHKHHCKTTRASRQALGSSSPTYQMLNDLRLWSRLYLNVLLEAIARGSDLLEKSNNGFDEALVIRLSRTAESSPTRVAHFFTVENVKMDSLHMWVLLHPSLAQEVGRKNAEVKAKGLLGAVYVLLLVHDKKVLLNVPQLISADVLDLIKRDIIPTDRENWQSDFTAAIASGRSIPGWVASMPPGQA